MKIERATPKDAANARAASALPTSFVGRERKAQKSYDSAAMKERRQKILKCTQAIIDKEGVEAVTLRRVGREAEVSVQTIYKAFQDREKLIAAAFESDFLIKLADFGIDGDDTEAIFEYIDQSAEILPNNIEQTRVMVRAFFSETPEENLYATLRTFSELTTKAWLERIRKEGDLSEWADHDVIYNKIGSLRFNVILDWLAGRVSDETLSSQLKVATLSVLVGVTEGQRRDELGRYLGIEIRKLKEGADSERQ